MLAGGRLLDEALDVSGLAMRNEVQRKSCSWRANRA